MNTNNIAWTRIRGGVYEVANGRQKIGTIRGDYKAGFWAYTVEGVKLPQTFNSIREATTVMARTHTRYLAALVLSA